MSVHSGHISFPMMQSWGDAGSEQRGAGSGPGSASLARRERRRGGIGGEGEERRGGGREEERRQDRRGERRGGGIGVEGGEEKRRGGIGEERGHGRMWELCHFNVFVNHLLGLYASFTAIWLNCLQYCECTSWELWEIKTANIV